MSKIYKIATINLKGIATPPTIDMLENLQNQEIGIIRLQEVTRPVFDDIRGSSAYTNIGTTWRGTANLTRDHIQPSKVECLPTGKGMAAKF